MPGKNEKVSVLGDDLDGRPAATYGDTNLANGVAGHLLDIINGLVHLF